MLLARKVLFYFFFLIYLVFCPRIILYSFGYIFNPAKNKISQTGLLRVATAPSQAEIFLGHRRYKYRTPATINGLIPGNYTLTVRLRGYRPWEHTVSVEEGKAAVFENILLIPSVLKQRKISEDIFTGLTPLSGTGYLLLRSGPNLGEFFSLDLDKEDLERLVFLGSPEADFPVISSYIESNSGQLVLYCGSLWDRRYFLKIFGDGEDGVIDITKLVAGRPNMIIWSHENEKNLFTLYENHVDRIDIDSVAVFPRYLENIKGFGVAGEKLYILDEDNFVIGMNYDKKDLSPVIRDSILNRKLLRQSNFYRINEFQKDVFVFWGDRGQLVAAYAPFVLADKDVRGMEYNEQARRLAFWSRKNIWIADFGTEEPSITAGSGKSVRLSTVDEKGKDIQQCFWANEGGHLVCRDRDIVFLIELEPDGKHHKEQLIEVRGNTDIFYSDINGRLYYLDNKSGYLLTAEIIPKKDFIFKAFMQENREQNN
jgi:hypothetical protein